MTQEEANNQVFGISVEQLEEIREQARAKAQSHTWKQKGGWLVCTSCEYQHRSYLGLDKQMVGIDKEGKPILESIRRQ
jgi:hypothetical protein